MPSIFLRSSALCSVIPGAVRAYRSPRLPIAAAACLLAVCGAPKAAHAVSCTTQSQMVAAEREDVAQAAQQIGRMAAAGNVNGLKAATIPSVAAQFDGIAGTVDSLAPLLKGATVSVENIYALHASDLKAPAASAEPEAVEFFCSVPGTALLVSISIPGLPAGEYALAIVHANGVAKPQQFGMILQQTGGPSASGAPQPAGAKTGWKLAGFFARPLTSAGHDGLWYWSAARDYAKKKDFWSAYFYYQTAAFLLTPVDFLSSPNLAKLEKEMAAVRPQGLPGGDTPETATMTLASGDQTFKITQLRTDSSLGGLDLVVEYTAPALSDPVAARSQAVALMHALLAQHPELRSSFAGLWVYANTTTRQPFAIEQPMNQIQ